jgi:hypothetical protein
MVSAEFGLDLVLPCADKSSTQGKSMSTLELQTITFKIQKLLFRTLDFPSHSLSVSLSWLIRFKFIQFRLVLRSFEG